MAILFLVTLLDLVGFGIVIPLLPSLFTNPNSPYSVLPSGMSAQQGYVLFGILVATYPFLQFFCAPIWGQLSDKYGRKWLLAISMLCMTAANGLFAYGLIQKSILLLFVSKALGGAAGGNLSIAQAIVTDLFAPRHRARQFGVIAAAFGIGMVLGPYLGGKLIDPTIHPLFSIQTPFVFATVLSLLSAVSIMLFLPETLKKEEEGSIHWLQAIGNILNAYELKQMRAIFLVGFLFQASFAFFASFINVYLYKQFQFSEGAIGEFFGYIGLWIAIAQIVLSKPIHARFSNRQIVLWSLVVYASTTLLLLGINNVAQLFVLGALFAIANALAQISILALVSEQAHEKSQGKILGLNASIYAVAQMIPPLLSGVLAATLGSTTPIVVAGLVAYVAAFVFLVSGQKRQVET